jgi:hypothetical protein
MTIACHPQRPMTRRFVRDALRRAPQDRWAAAFGRIAGYSFAVAVVTGIPLLPFFRPSIAPAASAANSSRPIPGAARTGSTAHTGKIGADRRSSGGPASVRDH